MAPMITSAEPAIATTPAAVSAGLGELGDREAGRPRAAAPSADQQPPAPAAAAALGLGQPGAGDEHAQAPIRAPVENKPPMTTTAAAAVTISAS